MILPSKHLSQEKALLTVGAEILQQLTEPITVSSLWEKMPIDNNKGVLQHKYHYDTFVLALDLLFILGALKLEESLLYRRLS